jgi:hypothetical protein
VVSERGHDEQRQASEEASQLAEANRA